MTKEQRAAMKGITLATILGMFAVTDTVEVFGPIEKLGVQVILGLLVWYLVTKQNPARDKMFCDEAEKQRIHDKEQNDKAIEILGKVEQSLAKISGRPCMAEDIQKGKHDP